MPKLSYAIACSLIFLMPGPLHAQQQQQLPSLTPAVKEQGSDSQSIGAGSLVEAYALTNDSLNRQTAILGLIAGILGAFMTVALVIFGIRQLSAEREIKEYRNNLRQNEEAFKKDYAKKLLEMKEATSEFSALLQKIKTKAKQLEEKSDTPETKEELSKLKEEVDLLKQKFSFESGRLSTLATSGISSTVSFLDSPTSSIFTGTNVEPWLSVDRNTGTASNYGTQVSSRGTGARVDVGDPLSPVSTNNVCPNCGQFYSTHSKNEKGAYICPLKD